MPAPAEDTFASGASYGAPADFIGGVRVVGRLGDGSLAEVFRGVQPSLGRPVAIKMLKSSVTTGSQLGRRFQREAVLLSRLAHQNIPQVYGSGEIDGRPYILLELIEGISLAQLLQPGGALPQDVASIIAHKLARALEYVHLRGIVHRDLKPSNVLISSRGEVKLTDFGIAKDADEDHDTLGVVGSPAYMSPEQVLGDRLDFRSDLFSFGILFYEMLTNRRPFEEEPARTVMQKIRLDRYIPPRRVRRDVPGALERILARCLEKNPAHRYPSTGLLADDLELHLAQQAVPSHETRLVAFLAERGSAGAKDTKRALAGAARVRDAGERRSRRLRGFIAAQTILALIGAAAVGASEMSASRTASRRASSTPGVLPPGERAAGFLRVVARPWAHLAIDGQSVDTTPTARAFRLAPGRHYVRLTNPTFASEDRTIQIERGSTVWLDIDLTPSVTTSGARSR